MIQNESNPPEPTDTEDKLNCFSSLRCIKIYLEPESGHLCGDVFDIFRKLDKLFALNPNEVQIGLSCSACQKIEQSGFFDLDQGSVFAFILQDRMIIQR